MAGRTLRFCFFAGWAAVGLFLGLLLWYAWQGPDIFYHLFLGRQVLETGSFQPPERLLVAQPEYRNVYWLFQIAVFGAWSLGGVYGVTSLFLLVWLLVVFLWARTAALHQVPGIGIPLTLVAVLVFQTRFEPRPESFSYLILVLQIGWLVRWRFGESPATPRSGVRAPGPLLTRLVLFALTEAVWVNLHGYFVLGPAVVGARLLAAIIHREGGRARNELLLLLVVTLAATLATPFGFGAWRFVGTLWVFLGEMKSAIREFGPPTGPFLRLWTVKLFWALWGATLLAGVWLAVRRRLGLFPILLGAAGLYLSATGVRNLPLLPLLGAPLWRQTMGELGSFAGIRARRGENVRLSRAGRREGPPVDRPAAGRSDRLAMIAASCATTAIALALSLWVVSGGFHHSLLAETSFGAGLPPHAYPVRASQYLARHGAEGRLLNSAADGGYLEFHLPDLQVFMDSRYVEAEPVRRYFAALSRPEVFEELNGRYAFDGVLLKLVDSGPLVIALLGDPEWRLAYGDLHRVLFARRDSPIAARWPDEPVRFYEGDDLSQRVNGMAAIQWTAILVQVRDRGRLLEALRAFDRSPEIPSFVLQYALQYALQFRDREVFEQARRMAPRMLALTPENRVAVERLLRVGGGLPPP